MNHLNDPFNSSTPFFDVWPPYNDTRATPEQKRQADLYLKGHYPEGNPRSNKRTARKNKKMAQRKARR